MKKENRKSAGPAQDDRRKSSGPLRSEGRKSAGLSQGDRRISSGPSRTEGRKSAGPTQDDRRKSSGLAQQAPGEIQDQANRSSSQKPRRIMPGNEARSKGPERKYFSGSDYDMAARNRSGKLPVQGQTGTGPAHKADLGRVQLSPSALLSPVPVVLVSCAGLPGSAWEKPNLVTVAWAGTIASDPPAVSISLRKSRLSYRQIRDSGEFTINLVSRSLLRAADFCGVKSGRDVDKFAACQLTPGPMTGLRHAPGVLESPLRLACRVRQVIDLGSHDCFIAEIVSVDAAAGLMDRKGKMALDQADLVTYVHGEYFSLGEKLGFFGYSVAGQDVLKRRSK